MTAAGLPPIGDLDTLERTRLSWHSVAEHVLAPARYHAEGRIGLRVTPGGFGTPPLPSGTTARVEGAMLVVDGDEAATAALTTTALTTIAAAATALGIEPGAPADVYTPTTPLAPDVPLVIDADAAAALAAWFALGWTALEALRVDASSTDGASDPTLWPEHFDAAIDLGDEDLGARGGFGASPGDAAHREPYLYVTHWADVADDPYWNDAAFPGASLSYTAVAAAPDATAAARDFFTRGRAALSAGANPR
ncbi:MAG: hypothetical protein MUP97_11725 [Acidimicrobiia bacterium]|nr:hypothetical protein [Acidimicrobiia bacterium]